mmetsp:Transcript_31629/g.73824  ORF Transcript_31629/g.73824 Transcript_31629/m.73824 type:complete len:100 (-) Transcript_31629:19-318(-)
MGKTGHSPQSAPGAIAGGFSTDRSTPASRDTTLSALLCCTRDDWLPRLDAQPMKERPGAAYLEATAAARRAAEKTTGTLLPLSLGGCMLQVHRYILFRY